MSEEESMESEMREQFGDAQTDEHIMTTKATRAFLVIHGAFMAAETGSVEEVILREKLNGMIQDLLTSSNHAVALAQTLSAIVLHMDLGGSLNSFFHRLGMEGPFER